MFTISDWLTGRQDRPSRKALNCGRMAACAVAGFALFGAAHSANADPKALSFDSTPVTDAVAQIDRAFGAYITIKPGVNADGLVSFTVPNVNDAGARLEAVNDLANALNASYSKTYVISNATGDTPVTAPAVDAVEAPVVFPSATMDATDAIRTIAAIDDASVQFYSPVKGTVTFASTQTTALDAAKEIARQTHTVWKAFYAITPRRVGRTATGASAGKIIGYTAGGQPITELPVQTFRASVNPEPPSTEDTTQTGTDKDTASSDTTATGDTSTSDSTTKNQVTPAAPTNPYPYGYYPYPGYYGYGYGYPGYAPSAPPVVIGPGMGVNSYGSTYNPYGGGYGYGYGYGGYAPGSGTTVIGASPITMMPSFGTGSWY